jgi:uracil-DNA glycosylase family 4
MISKEDKFNTLLDSVEKCNLCQRLNNRKKILSNENGNINSKVLFVAEAPGRLGAECCGIPLYGDKTGDNFDLLLNNIGWKRDQIFITNSILCNPQDENGNNSSPNKNEIKNCNYFLNMIIELLDPIVIVTLGVKALEALKLIKNHNYDLKNNVAQLIPWNNRKLFPLYHMGPRALIHRNIIKQRGDFISLSNIIDPEYGIKEHKKIVTQKRDDNVVNIIKYIIKTFSEISFFTETVVALEDAVDLHLLARNDALDRDRALARVLGYLALATGADLRPARRRPARARA